MFPVSRVVTIIASLFYVLDNNASYYTTVNNGTLSPVLILSRGCGQGSTNHWTGHLPFNYSCDHRPGLVRGHYLPPHFRYPNYMINCWPQTPDFNRKYNDVMTQINCSNTDIIVQPFSTNEALILTKPTNSDNYKPYLVSTNTEDLSARVIRQIKYGRKPYTNLL